MSVYKWEKPRKLRRIMVKEGFPPEEARRTRVKMNKRQSEDRKRGRFALNLERFRRVGLLLVHDFTLAAPGSKSGR